MAPTLFMKITALSTTAVFCRTIGGSPCQPRTPGQLSGSQWHITPLSSRWLLVARIGNYVIIELVPSVTTDCVGLKHELELGLPKHAALGYGRRQRHYAIAIYEYRFAMTRASRTSKYSTTLHPNPKGERVIVVRKHYCCTTVDMIATTSERRPCLAKDMCSWRESRRFQESLLPNQAPQVQGAGGPSRYHT